jgi:hypothetical protein
MTEPFELKPITPDGLEAAVKRAEHYRLLNHSAEARSICLDVLAVDPDRQDARVVLILALTDQFSTGESSAHQARDHLEHLRDEYQRHYYQGIIAERQARAMLRKGPAAAFAYEGFREAMHWYEQAAEIRPEGIDDAILRWNSCVRTITEANLKPRPREAELSLE